MLQERERRAQASWQTNVGSNKEKLVGKHARIQQLVREIEDASRRMRDHEKRWGNKTIRPYDSPNEGDTPLVERAVYEQAREYLSDHRWGPLACRQRIQGQLNAVLTILEQEPALSSELKSLIEQAENYITDIERTWQPEESDPESDPDTVNPDENDLNEPEPEGETPRVDELYELIICVGYVLTCNHHFFAQGTIKAMLETIQFLDRCSKAEISEYKQRLTERSQRNSEMDVVGKGKKLKPRWQKSRRRWVRYCYNKAKGSWGLKLAQKAGPQAKRLLAKHGLTADDIRQAHERKREFKAKQHHQRASASG